MQSLMVKRGGYSEKDLPNPLSTYARHKLEGEKGVLEANPEAIVARVNFFGWSLNNNRSLSEWFFNNLTAGNQVKGFTDVKFCPLMANDLATLLLQMASSSLKGLYHVLAPTCLSKYEFGVLIARQFGLDENLITPASWKDGGLQASRSPNLILKVDKLINDLGIVPPVPTDGIKRFAELWQNGYADRIKHMFLICLDNLYKRRGWVWILKLLKKTIGLNHPTYLLSPILLPIMMVVWNVLKNSSVWLRKLEPMAAKFQNFRASQIVSAYGFDTMGKQQSHQSTWKKSVVEVYQDASIPFEWTPVLKETCDKYRIHYFSSPYDFEMIDKLDAYMPAYKIGSGEITWIEALEHMARKGKTHHFGDRGIQFRRSAAGG